MPWRSSTSGTPSPEGRARPDFLSPGEALSPGKDFSPLPLSMLGFDPCNLFFLRDSKYLHSATTRMAHERGQDDLPDERESTIQGVKYAIPERRMVPPGPTIGAFGGEASRLSSRGPLVPLSCSVKKERSSPMDWERLWRERTHILVHGRVFRNRKGDERPLSPREARLSPNRGPRG